MSYNAVRRPRLLPSHLLPLFGPRAMRTRIHLACLFASVALVAAPATTRADDWPQWRGPHSNGAAAPGYSTVKSMTVWKMGNMTD